MGPSRPSRIAANIILGASILYLPWWSSLLLALLFSLIFERYYEIIVAGILVDLLYNVPGTRGFRNSFQTSELAVLTFFVAGSLRERITKLTE